MGKPELFHIHLSPGLSEHECPGRLYADLIWQRTQRPVRLPQLFPDGDALGTVLFALPALDALRGEGRLLCQPHGLGELKPPLGAFGVLTGIFMIVFGAVKIVGYLSRDLYRLAFQYDLAFGILSIALGIMVILEPDDVIDTICIAVGIAFAMDGLLKIQIALDSKYFGIREWWLIFRPSESLHFLMLMLGISLLTDGILNLITVLSTVKIISHQFPDRMGEEFDDYFLE